jgi:hypothetical protein
MRDDSEKRDRAEPGESNVKQSTDSKQEGMWSKEEPKIGKQRSPGRVN